MCGGAGDDTGTLLVRRGYVKGPNFDIIAGFDLKKESTVKELLRYLAVAKPVVLIISTPCTGMKGFSALNRSLNPAAWRRSRKLSVPLAKLAALVALRQMSEGRHFIAEHPQGSDMWSLPEWLSLESRFPVHKVDVDQCMLGLRGPRTKALIKKPTTFWASDARLLARLHGLRCDGRHVHADLAATTPGKPHEKAKNAARWPLTLCRRIAAGCEEVIREHHRRQKDAAKEANERKPGRESAAAVEDGGGPAGAQD